MMVIAPHAQMREKPAFDSEVVSDSYFSEEVTVLEESGDWLKVKTQSDSYEGWLTKNVVKIAPESYFEGTIAKVTRTCAHLYDRKDTVYGPMLSLPFESRLKVLDSEDPRWIEVELPDNRKAYIQRGCVTFNHAPISLTEMLSLADNFLGIDYMWGGRSSFGYDCSGFVQMLYRQMGIFLPRDSKEQIRCEQFTATTRETLKPGDTVFFGLDQDKIRHMGLYIGDGMFIHATVAQNMPWIRKSSLDEAEWNGQGRFKYVAFRTKK